jgi:hypothetical protein
MQAAFELKRKFQDGCARQRQDPVWNRAPPRIEPLRVEDRHPARRIIRQGLASTARVDLGKEEILIVLGKSSPEAALPTLMEKMERLGCSKALVGLVVPAGPVWSVSVRFIDCPVAINRRDCQCLHDPNRV